MRTPLETHLTTGEQQVPVQEGSSRARSGGGEGNPGLTVILESGTNSGDSGDTFTPTMVLADNSVSMGGLENLLPMLPNLSTGNNALSTTLTVVMDVPEHIATDAQLYLCISTSRGARDYSQSTTRNTGSFKLSSTKSLSFMERRL